jgi:hypothetical protein
MRLDLDAQLAVGAGARGADPASVETLQRHGSAATGQPDVVGDVRHGADGGELLPLARDEHDALLGADIDRQRDCHGREDDRIVHGDEQHRLKLLTHGK